ncbi:flagellar biosynthetic protein FliO [Sporolactobacillus sp. THM7-4]|nr:flagellar biosynthetic protein FliO [Sporolactobacillus sp. THM7-4]
MEKGEGGNVLRKGLFSVLAVLLLILGQNICALAAGSGNGTVDELFKSQHGNQKSNDGGDQADNPESAHTQKPLENANLFVAFLKLIFALFIVLALIYILYHFVAKRTRKFQQGSALENIGGVSVGTNRSVQLIRVGKEVLVVGVGETVQVLKEISDPEAIEALRNQEEKPDVLEENVKKVLNWTADRGWMRKDNTLTHRSSLKSLLVDHLGELNKERSEKIEDMLREEKKDE